MPPGAITLSATLSDEHVERIARRAAELVAERQQDSPYLNAEQAGQYLRCAKGRIYDLVQLGRIEPVRDGRRLLFHRATLTAYLEAGS